MMKFNLFAASLETTLRQGLMESPARYLKKKHIASSISPSFSYPAQHFKSIADRGKDS